MITFSRLIDHLNVSTLIFWPTAINLVSCRKNDNNISSSIFPLKTYHLNPTVNHNLLPALYENKAMVHRKTKSKTSQRLFTQIFWSVIEALFIVIIFRSIMNFWGKRILSEYIFRSDYINQLRKWAEIGTRHAKQWRKKNVNFSNRTLAITLCIHWREKKKYSFKWC